MELLFVLNKAIYFALATAGLSIISYFIFRSLRKKGGQSPEQQKEEDLKNQLKEKKRLK